MSEDDEIMFEDGDGIYEEGSFELVVVLIKNIMKRFRN
jgi:hypothetical protein